MHERWRRLLVEREVAPAEVAAIERQLGLERDDFGPLEAMEEITDPTGKAWFLLPTDVGDDEVRRAVLLTYVLNVGTGYGLTSEVNDFAETAYSSAEVRRIGERQAANAWTYRRAVGVVHGNGGRLVTTPNGMLMGAGGSRGLRLLSRRGGTTWGDLFLLNLPARDGGERVLRSVIGSGRANVRRPDGSFAPGRLPLARLLHHEERHARQWARRGPVRFAGGYLWEQVRRGNQTEQDAGLGDGGYRRPADWRS